MRQNHGRECMAESLERTLTQRKRERKNWGVLEVKRGAREIHTKALNTHLYLLCVWPNLKILYPSIISNKRKSTLSEVKA
jgi:hypothetical protein